jgi:hypothetical protein
MFPAAVSFRMPVLPAKPLHFTNGHPFNAYLLQGTLDFIQSGKIDHSFDFFHTFFKMSFNYACLWQIKPIKQLWCQSK